MQKRFKKLLLTLSALIFSLSSQAEGTARPDLNQSYYGGKSEGWFWYQDPVEKKQTDKKPPEKKKDEPKKDDSFSVSWLKKNLPVLMEKALDNPTKDNVAAYLFAQRVAMDKAQKFEEKAMQVAATDPVLDENNRAPMSSYGREAFMNMNYRAKEESLKYLAHNVGGLFVFIDSTCSYCRAQAPSINDIANNYGFNIKYISIDGKGIPEVSRFVKDNGISKKLNIKIWPTTVMAVPPNNFYVLSQGIMTTEDLKERILLAATSNKLLPERLMKGVQPWDKGVLTSDDLKDGASAGDPASFADGLRKKIEKRF